MAVKAEVCMKTFITFLKKPDTTGHKKTHKGKKHHIVILLLQKCSSRHLGWYTEDNKFSYLKCPIVPLHAFIKWHSLEQQQEISIDFVY